MNHVYFNHSCLNESQRLIDSRTKLTKLSPAHPPKSQSSVGCVEFLGGPFSEVSTVVEERQSQEEGGGKYPKMTGKEIIGFPTNHFWDSTAKKKTEVYDRFYSY